MQALSCGAVESCSVQMYPPLCHCTWKHIVAVETKALIDAECRNYSLNSCCLLLLRSSWGQSWDLSQCLFSITWGFWCLSRPPALISCCWPATPWGCSFASACPTASCRVFSSHSASIWPRSISTPHPFCACTGLSWAPGQPYNYDLILQVCIVLDQLVPELFLFVASLFYLPQCHLRRSHDPLVHILKRRADCFISRIILSLRSIKSRSLFFKVP